MDKLNRIKELVNELNAASDAYYNGKETLMTDAEFDSKLKRLSELEKETGVIMSNSPTINVGSPVLKEIKTIKMEQKPMLSLDKVHSFKEVVDFSKGKQLVASIKCDGMSTRLVYQDGVLVSANSRGNGTEGSDLTEHIKHFTNVPLTIDKKGTYIVDGESIIKDMDFELVNSKLSDKNKLKNSRNAVAGTLASLDTSVVDERRVSFIAWDVIEGGNNTSFFERLNEATSLGFEVVPYVLVRYISENIIEDYINGMFNESKTYGIPNDGVVFRLDDIKYGDSLGHTSHHFLNAVAYKAAAEYFPSKLIDVEWTMGKTGSLCPTIITEPIEIDGTIVERASVHNCTIFKEFAFSKGCTCYLYKANKIIPQCYCVEDNTEELFEIPSVCPVCGAKTEIIKDGIAEVLYCTSDSCSGKMLGKLNAFVSKQGMDINGLSEATLQLLLDRGYISSFKDLYHLSDYRVELSSLPKMGAKSVAKLLKSIEDSRKTTLDKFLTALSIPLLGRSTSKDIAKYCHDNVGEFIFIINNTALELLTIDGFGRTMLDSLLDWWDSNADMVHELIEELEFEMPEEKTEITTDEKRLDGMNFVVTGSVHYFKNRAELQSKIESLGGKVVGSVSAKTNVLINNDVNSNSSKNLKAKSLNIPIWNEDDFLKYIETN